MLLLLMALLAQQLLGHIPSAHGRAAHRCSFFDGAAGAAATRALMYLLVGSFFLVPAACLQLLLGAGLSSALQLPHCSRFTWQRLCPFSTSAGAATQCNTLLNAQNVGVNPDHTHAPAAASAVQHPLPHRLVATPQCSVLEGPRTFRVPPPACTQQHWGKHGVTSLTAY
jgi:hypothetical protein